MMWEGILIIWLIIIGRFSIVTLRLSFERSVKRSRQDSGYCLLVRNDKF